MKIFRAEEIERMRNKLRKHANDLDEAFHDIMVEGRKQRALKDDALDRDVTAGDCCAEQTLYASQPLGLPRFTDEELRCIDKAVRAFFVVEMADRIMQKLRRIG